MAGERRKHHLYLQPLPITGIIAYAPSPVKSAQQQILIGGGTLLGTVHVRDLGCMLLMGINPQPGAHGKTIFHKTSPWCQKRLGNHCFRSKSLGPAHTQGRMSQT